ncbi:Phytocyanin domain [Arabidopsis thaliana x Arabidopsis arenosa]|uniref:Basic blue protein n=2 Tax=Arabidopsis TaxID=3701 RepID=A0A178WHW6_ARATH|nr:Phytocyanin domain [Arabidopsis thaliana x Arabidopsis arenosa]OAP17950.1 ENODL22 [Arabidopsis thaliana]
MAQSSGHVSYVAVTVPIAIVMTVLCLFLAKAVTYARRPTTYIVGDDDGWDPVVPMDTWARGKTFYAGDILEFKYDYQRFNLIVVNRTGYETCEANVGAVEYSSGDDKIQLHYGYNYFIGTYTPEDCTTGLKMAIKALAPR